MRQTTAHPPMAEEQDQAPPDIDTMRETIDLLLGPDDGPDGLPPVVDLALLTAAVRGHLELLLPEVERLAGQLPRHKTYYAFACVSEARRELGIEAGPELEHRVVRARRLARALSAVCNEHERLQGAAS
ncbi:DUF6415 family natural product biosynthesis protein [Streptomyces hyaluromycini]|uniref:DUF6415 family natural product biosynthesis protein n=1 Tax=Streptomyces hyaluromycini TaxID=1377993 RepID=UPI0011AE1D2A|nr:DUF6415 family natural product biosynthesis protein [Streptomyces hyaluromycini]